MINFKNFNKSSNFEEFYLKKKYFKGYKKSQDLN